MKKTYYEGAWTNFLVSAVLIGVGVAWEPLLAVLGGIIILTTLLVASVANRIQDNSRKIERSYPDAETQSILSM